MDPDDIESINVLKGTSATAIYGSRAANGVILITTKGRISNEENALPIEIQKIKNNANVEYKIITPSTILSDGNHKNIEMQKMSIPAIFEYQSVPKLKEEVFLFAKISDWEQYNLVEGEVNLYFEKTFTGKSFLDVKYLSDTLSISLGRDKNILVKREKQKESSGNQLIGNKRKEFRSYEIIVRNNKNSDIKITLFDQVPISTIKEIQVENLELSGAEFDENTGKVNWTFELKPKELKKVTLRYSVKYPKNKPLLVE